MKYDCQKNFWLDFPFNARFQWTTGFTCLSSVFQTFSISFILRENYSRLRQQQTNRLSWIIFEQDKSPQGLLLENMLWPYRRGWWKVQIVPEGSVPEFGFKKGKPHILIRVASQDPSHTANISRLAQGSQETQTRPMSSWFSCHHTETHPQYHSKHYPKTHRSQSPCCNIKAQQHKQTGSARPTEYTSFTD